MQFAHTRVYKLDVTAARAPISPWARSGLAAIFTAVLTLLLGCGGPAASPLSGRSITELVFDSVAPSVVAVLNDDRDVRDDEAKHTLHDMGLEGHSPKSVIDVSLRKEPTPHGTGFLIDGGLVLTAAHVVHSPTHLKLITRDGQHVDAEVVRIDEMRDVAVLRPKTPLVNVPAIGLLREKARVGDRIWALGHTGGGLWALSWGITEGITSGVVDLLGAQLVVHDAAVYPGFSGGPVVMLDSTGAPKVVGVNHAILYTGGLTIATISSASSVKDIEAVLNNTPHPLEKILAEYRQHASKDTHADLFVTNNLAVHKDHNQLSTAAIYGNTRVMEASDDVRLPIVAMVFGKEPGSHDIEFRVTDQKDQVLTYEKKKYDVPMHERIGFVTGDLHFSPKSAGRYEVLAFQNDKRIGHTDIWVEDPNDDKDLVNDNDIDDLDSGEPHVSVVVAQSGNIDPLTLLGIRAGWSEWSYPRRVPFTWFARGSRGWSGTNVAISAFVLDDRGHVVGRGVGCIQSEIRPEVPWNCMGDGGTPLIEGAGHYDIVFAINDRPVALWPMEAVSRSDGAGGLEHWVDEMRHQGTFKKVPR